MKIAIDPGHGMSNRSPGVFDPGAVAEEGGETFREVDIALRYSLALRDALRGKGVDVFMTRDDSTDVAPVGQRAGNAEQQGCEAFVSLHLNAFETPAANGVEVLYRDEAHEELASAVTDGVVEATGLKRRPTKKRMDLAVLRFEGPAILIELGFITNKRDRDELLNPSVRAGVVAKVAEILIAKLGAGASVSRRAGAGIMAAATYVLPAYARAAFGEGSGIPWSTASPLPGFNFYSGLVRESFHTFPSTSQLPGGALFYEAKFAIDGDGSGDGVPGDTFLPNTSLHDAQGTALNSREFPFIVLPMRHAHAGKPQWADLGVKLGDLGICFYKDGTSVAVLFGDSGPWRKLGEGSMLAADELGINSDPVRGGIGPSEVPPGILHFVFPGSGRTRAVAGNRPRTDDTAETVERRARALFAAFTGTSAGAGHLVHRRASGGVGRVGAVRLPGAPSGGPVVSANVMETLAHTGSQKVIVKLAPQMRAGAALAAGNAKAGGGERLGADLESLFIDPGEDGRSLLASASASGKSAHAGGRPAAPKVHYYPRLGLAVGTISNEGAAALAAHTRVQQVVKAPELSLIRPIGGKPMAAAAGTTAWGLKRLGVEELWRRGIKGRDVLVGHLDTGIDGTHRALKTAIAEFAEFDLAARRVEGARATDSAEHGTHTAGTIAGREVNGVRIGVAPEARLLSGMVIEGGQVIERILAGMEWVVERNARILSMSLGLRGFTTAFEVVVQALRDNRVLPVIAVGNEFANSSRSPGNYPNVLSVGASDEDDRVADFSSSQAFVRHDDPIVPDIVAPGVDILSCSVGTGYRLDSGTSMATPHIAGLAALLLSAKPDASVDELERAILSSCALPSTMMRNRANRGIPAAVQALEALLGHSLAQPEVRSKKKGLAPRKPANGSGARIAAARMARAESRRQSPRKGQALGKAQSPSKVWAPGKGKPAPSAKRR